MLDDLPVTQPTVLKHYGKNCTRTREKSTNLYNDEYQHSNSYKRADTLAIGHTFIQTKNKVTASAELKTICQWATSARLTYLSGSSNISCSDWATFTA